MVSRAQYTALPNPNQELDDAFGSDDDERDFDADAPGENTPMISHAAREAARSRSPSPPLPLQPRDFQPHPPPPVQPSQSSAPPAYNFEYDYPPPPGSPPRPSALALPNNIGNSNGLIPTSTTVITPPRRQGWFRRTVGAILPTHFNREPTGGGTDGVWANVQAAPAATNPDAIERVRAGDEVYTMPEEAQKDAPPSYATAQADAVPPYWETTILAPSMGIAGELLVDGIPAGSVFSFMCNLLISMSFQFIGFMLTSILASTHAARYGSRAGLGITLIQYGFYLRTRDEIQSTRIWNATPSQPSWQPKPESSADKLASDGGSHGHNHTPTPTYYRHSSMGDLTTLNEWLSFFLMTIGWFVLLTSVLSFWRTKRWERGLQQSSPPENSGSAEAIVAPASLTFGVFPGLVFGNQAAAASGPITQEDRDREEEVRSNIERAFGLATTPQDQERLRRMEQARRVDERLQADLRAAGLL